jgi:hypothetical protein
MKKILDIAQGYLERSDWKTISVLKVCLFSLGVLCGLQICEKHKKPARYVAGGVFLLTYIPLLVKLFRVMRELRPAAETSTQPHRGVCPMDRGFGCKSILGQCLRI